MHVWHKQILICLAQVANKVKRIIVSDIIRFWWQAQFYTSLFTIILMEEEIFEFILHTILLKGKKLF